VAGLRDYAEWHKAYDDPDSGLSWRLREVQRFLEEALDRHVGPIQVLSLCAGDGRDLLSVLCGRGDAGRVDATLIEIHPALAERARTSAREAGLSQVEVRTLDAGDTSSYDRAAPADIVMMIGIFGNISDADVERTVKASPQLCRPGATLLWSRGRAEDDRNAAIRTWFQEAGFSELDYVERDVGSRPALGAMAYRGEPKALVAGCRLFSFLR